MMSMLMLVLLLFTFLAKYNIVDIVDIAATVPGFRFLISCFPEVILPRSDRHSTSLSRYLSMQERVDIVSICPIKYIRNFCHPFSVSIYIIKCRYYTIKLNIVSIYPIKSIHRLYLSFHVSIYTTKRRHSTSLSRYRPTQSNIHAAISQPDVIPPCIIICFRRFFLSHHRSNKDKWMELALFSSSQILIA